MILTAQSRSFLVNAEDVCDNLPIFNFVSIICGSLKHSKSLRCVNALLRDVFARLSKGLRQVLKESSGRSSRKSRRPRNVDKGSDLTHSSQQNFIFLRINNCHFTRKAYTTYVRTNNKPEEKPLIPRPCISKLT